MGNATIEEKDQYIDVLQTQIHLLKTSEKEVKVKLEENLKNGDPKLPEELENIRKEKEILETKSAQLKAEMQKEIENLKQQVLKIAEEKTMAIAETKQQNHKTILEKDNEVVEIRSVVASLKKEMGKTKEENNKQREEF